MSDVDEMAEHLLKFMAAERRAVREKVERIGSASALSAMALISGSKRLMSHFGKFASDPRALPPHVRR